VFTAGAGGRNGRDATTLVDGEGPGKLAAAAEIAGVRRFLLVSVFPEAWRERQMPVDFEHYMVEKKKAETKIVLTDLNWIIVRPSALTNNPGEGRVDLGPAKVHLEITRDDVAHTIVELLRRPEVNRVILELTGGMTPIDEAITAIPQCTSTTVGDRLGDSSPLTRQRHKSERLLAMSWAAAEMARARPSLSAELTTTMDSSLRRQTI
jgi:hypothetical protein